MLPRQIATLTMISFVAVGLAVAVSAARPAATEAGGGCHMPDGTGYTEGPATVVRMDVCSFSPTVARVPVGTTVRFLNTATVEHIVAGRGQSWASEMLAPGAEFSEAFTTAGIYPFSCPLHPGMVGAVIVGEGGQAAAPVTPVEAGSAPASAGGVTVDPAGSAPVVPATLGAVGGGVIGLLVGRIVSRRRPAGTTTDAVRTTPALDG